MSLEKQPIPVNTPVITDSDRKAVDQCLAEGWASSEGPQVGQFEQAFARECERARGIAVSSGTAALDIAVRALGIGPGDEVLVPSLTIISCASAIIASGAKPVPVDCDPTDWNAHLHHFESRASSRTRAIMLVHLYGLCADLDPILQWAASRNILVIEDASQAIGLQYKNRPCGSLGHCSVFSLYANKLITAGEGGIILSNDEALADRCQRLRNLCFEPRKRFWHEELGWNYRMTAMQAALALSQLNRMPELVIKKREMGDRYRAGLGGIEHFATAPEHTEYCQNVYWVFGLVVGQNAPFSRDDLLRHLSGLKIGTRTFFYGLHEQPALLRDQQIDNISLPATEFLSQNGFYLPSGLGLTPAEQAIVIEAVTGFVEQYA